MNSGNSRSLNHALIPPLPNEAFISAKNLGRLWMPSEVKKVVLYKKCLDAG